MPSVLCKRHFLDSSPFVSRRSNKHAVPAMFARRLTRKNKVMRLAMRLALEENAATQPHHDATPDHDLQFQLGGDGVSVHLVELSDYLPLEPWEGTCRITPKMVSAALQQRVCLLTGNKTDRFDHGTLRIHAFAVARESGKRVRVHARRSYYGHGERYDWVRTRGQQQGEWWCGRLCLLVSMKVQGTAYEVAIIHWLEPVELARDHVLGSRHWRMWKPAPYAELVRTIWRRAFFVTSPKLEAGRRIFLQLPYGPTMLPEEPDSDIE